MTLTCLAPAAMLVAAGAIGGVVLRRAWRDRKSIRNDLRATGWGVFAVSVLSAAYIVGPILGLAFAVAAIPLGALTTVLGNVSRRPQRKLRDGQVASEPLEGRPKAWRGGLKALLAGPLGMLAAMAVAFCYASWAPGAVQTRLLIAALLVPGLWGLAMTWTLADQRIIRATAVLGGTTIFGFGLALLRGIA